MGAETTISWTDHTFNPWIGCQKVAPGCLHCYAEADMDLRRSRAKWGPLPRGTRSVTSEQYWKQPHHWNEDAANAGERRRVFCASLADVFEDWSGPLVDANRMQLWKSWDSGALLASGKRPKPRYSPLTMAEVRRRLFETIDATPDLDWLLLTKRPQNIREMWPEFVLVPNADGQGHDDTRRFRDNVWLGCSIATQEDADRDIPSLRRCGRLAPVLFLSIEPLLGPINLNLQSVLFGSRRGLVNVNGTIAELPGIDWVIIGGESGHGARPMHPDWARSIRDQCVAAGVPFHFKQWGEWAPEGPPSGNRILLERDGQCSPRNQPVGVGRHRRDGLVTLYRVGKKSAGRLLDGREWNEFPLTQPQRKESALA
jgi:protein gp37